MKIDSINNQVFCSKKFRLITTAIDYDRVGSTLSNIKSRGKYVQEFSNPKAKELYKQVQKTRDVQEQIRLYDEMGHYELKSLNLFEIMREKFEKFVMDNMF